MQEYNWCHNRAEIRHDLDSSMIDRLLEAFEDDRLLMEFVPTIFPEDSEEGFLFRVEFWGTLRDITRNKVIELEEPNFVILTFDSVWGPPLDAFKTMLTMDFQIKNYYCEPIAKFAGIWDNGIDLYFEAWKTSLQAQSILPLELNEMFNVSKTLDQQESKFVECFG